MTTASLSRDGETPSASTDSTMDALYARVRWRIMPFLCLGFLAAYIDRVNVGFAKFGMATDLRMGDAAFGLGAGLFFLGYILCEVPSNLLLQKVGARFWLARIMLTWGVLSGMTAFVSSTWSFCVARFLLGVAEAGFMPGALLYLSQWMPQARRGGASGLMMIGVPLASVIGAPLSGFLLVHCAGLASLAGWRWLFLVEALPPVALGAWAIMALPDRIETADWLSGEEKRQLRSALDEVPHHEAADVMAAFRDLRVWHLGLIDGAALLGLYTVAFWFPSFLKAKNVHDPMTIGIATVIPHLFAVLTMVLNGWHSDRTGERRWHIVLPIVLGALLLGGGTFLHGGVVLTTVLMTLANGAILGALPPFWCIPTNFLRGSAAAAGLAIACSFANLAGFVATALIGWTIEHTGGPDVALRLFACVMAAAAASLLLMPRAATETK